MGVTYLSVMRHHLSNVMIKYRVILQSLSLFQLHMFALFIVLLKVSLQCFFGLLLYIIRTNLRFATCYQIFLFSKV